MERPNKNEYMTKGMLENLSYTESLLAYIAALEDYCTSIENK